MGELELSLWCDTGAIFGGLPGFLRQPSRVFEATRIGAAEGPCNEDPGTLTREGSESGIEASEGLNGPPSPLPGRRPT
jgi:hypothetical protein